MWLKYPEADLWQLTPRIFKAQLDVHQDVQSQMYGGKSTRVQPTGFIDQIPGW